MRSVSSGRIRLISFAFLLFAFLLVFRLYVLQIVEHAAFVDKADQQYSNPESRIFDRGTIYFETKDGIRIPAATLQPVYTLAINPTLVTNPVATYESLTASVTPALDLNRDTFMQDAQKKSDYQEILHDQLTPDQADAITALNLSGVRLVEDRERSYPAGQLAAQVLGFMGYSSSTAPYAALYGLEKQYDDVLSRVSQDLYTNFFAQIFSNINQSVTYNAGGEGDVVTTIEPTVQKFLEDELEATNKEYSSQMTAGIIINPQNGEIYAMGQYPTFNPNFPGLAAADPSVYNNHSVESVYEMGSIMKSITMSSGINAGLVTPTSTYDDVGYIKLNGFTIWNYDLTGRGPHTTMQTVLDDSLNTGAAYVESRLGNVQFEDYLKKFGLLGKTGIDLPGELNDLTDNLDDGRDVEFATAAFGQGVAYTPIATVRALSAIANGGHLIQPHVVKEIDYTDGLVKKIDPGFGDEVVTASTSATISSMLIQVVDTALLNGTVKQVHYSMAAKTGTAQVVKPGGGYYDNIFNHTFFGYFPASHPTFLVFMITLQPHGQEYASHTLTAPFEDISKFLINYYNVPPDR